ncbi:MAG: deoxyribodipyrimidine photo-lyase [Pseudomonadota bacterium]
MSGGVQIVWFRNDLRLADQAALTAAASAGPILGVYCLDDAGAGDWALGGAQRWWLHHTLSALAKALAEFGVPLVLRRGPAAEQLADIAQSVGAQAIHATRHFEPYNRKREDAMLATGLPLKLHTGNYLRAPEEVRTGSGGPYKVFTPYWRASQALGALAAPLGVPEALTGYDGAVQSDALQDWALLPTAPDWSGGLGEAWTPGEAGAQARLHALSPQKVAAYKAERDFPAVDGTSQLSPHLHFGEITARQVYAQLATIMELDAAEPLIRQLGWRDFSLSLLQYAPHLPEASWSPKFRDFPWREDDEALERWQKGQTGYPIVDAGMRQLWQTGWMHNRVRMIVASFLCKHLLLHWRHGEDWFWDTLVDADLANNAAGWQWVAGSGADASPYFRIFNPITQSEKFDKGGDYIRTFVPELDGLPLKYLHAPWTAPQNVLQMSGVRLGDTYPKPMVDHSQARQRALDAYEDVKAA